jgi:hypothetical protein
MNYLKLAMIGLALGTANTVAAECTAPDVPDVADGATATMEQMMAGQKAVKEFQATNLNYMSCLDPLIEAAKTAATEDGASDADKATVKALEDQYNAAVSREEEVAGQFNTEIREYKAANPS